MQKGGHKKGSAPRHSGIKESLILFSTLHRSRSRPVKPDKQRVGKNSEGNQRGSFHGVLVVDKDKRIPEKLEGARTQVTQRKWSYPENEDE